MVAADEVARAVGESARLLSRAMLGRSEAGDGAMLWLCGADLPALNGVIAWDPDARAAEVERLLDAVAATGLPHSLQLRPTSSPALTALAERRGLLLVEETPLMLLIGPPRPRSTPRLAVRRLEPAEVRTHVEVMAAGFEMPPDEVQRVTTPELLRTPGVHAYLGEVEGEPVSTALGVRTGDAVGVLDVATPPARRRRGYGAALTAAAVADGLAEGARWAWLQSSHLGFGAYARLGFRELERWPFWVTRG